MTIKFFIYLFIVSNLFCTTECQPESHDQTLINRNIRDIFTQYEWTVVGAGPAGIIAIAMLLDLGIPASKIFWVDPTFSVGRLGEYYSNVDGNTVNKLWIQFLETFDSISSQTQDDIAYFQTLNPECYCTLDKIITPLNKVTQNFLTKVDNQHGYLQSLDFWNGVWHVQINDNIYSTRSVILATGASPIVVNYEEAKFSDIIPLDYALNKKFLEVTMKETDIVAVFGGAHSAILILKYLSELQTPIRKIFNFYNKDLIYAIDFECPLLKNTTTGPLLGVAAWWAKNVLLQNPPQNLLRLENTLDNREQYLSQCNKVIYAIGYKANPLPTISINEQKIDSNNITFDPESGIIAPRLFGLGIAFPGITQDSFGNTQLLIGLNSFSQYALDMMPSWIMETVKKDKTIILKTLNNPFCNYIQIQML